MATQRAHIVLPAELVREIDQLVGPRGRSAFLVETAEKEIKRRKLLSFLESDEPVWRDKDHPDLAKLGTAEWVRRLRREPGVRHKGRNEHFDPV
ncbi:MAG TPA: hypothetical protein VLZ50_01475 [Terracidiphilus sp.]|nr:hypothetical protein [Terracidiphilus sp.]